MPIPLEQELVNSPANAVSERTGVLLHDALGGQCQAIPLDLLESLHIVRTDERSGVQLFQVIHVEEERAERDKGD